MIEGDVSPGLGYRILNCSERIESDDQVWRDWDVWEDVHPSWWGSQVLPRYAQLPVRRKKTAGECGFSPPAAKRLKPGPGFRFLEVGERVDERTDEVVVGPRWVPVASVPEMRATRELERSLIRRRVGLVVSMSVLSTAFFGSQGARAT